MDIRDLLRFLAGQLESAVNNNEHERISEIGLAVEIFYEAAKSVGDNRLMSILDRMTYVVFHYRNEDPFTQMYLEEVAKQAMLVANGDKY